MNHDLWSLVRILTNSAITSTPIRVLRELERQGKRRLPDPVQRQVASRRTPRLKTLRFVYRWLCSEHLTRHKGQWVINSFLPPFPSPAFERMFTNLLSGRHLSPVSAYLAITAECPYNCWHCSLKNRRSGHMPTETWLAAIEQLHQLGCSVIGFTGGEPLWREDLATLIRAAHQGGATTIMYTCGARFLPERITELKAAGLWG
ncbi:MAG: radical SAM protein, partial [bacterium]|nr:radical SAM protein [bacterium]